MLYCVLTYTNPYGNIIIIISPRIVHVQMLNIKSLSYVLKIDHLSILLQNLVQSVNNLVENEEKVAWNRMREDTKDHYITKLLHTAEQGAVTLSKAYKHSAEVEIKTADMGKTSGRKFLFV